MKNFMGKDGFTWFVGVVEDRNDPQKLGRLRVRCLGYHTEDLTKLPTSDLPWAHVMNPITSATVSGVGQTPLGCVEGTWVVGWFTDGSDAQQPMIMGTLPGVPKDLPVKDAGLGFQDYINANYPKYKETDVNRLAVGDTDNPHSTLTLRKADRDLAVGIAQVDGIFDGVAQIPNDLDITSWDEPETEYAATYPRNHVYETEGGHIKEFDDTIGKERIHERHTSGTSYEIDNGGNRTDIIKGDHYTITAGKKQALIEGNSDLSINGRHKLYINKSGQSNNHYDIQVGPGASVNVQVDSGDINLVTTQGKVNVNAGGDYNVKVGGNYTLAVSGNKTETVEGNKTSSTTGNVVHKGARIDLNP